MKKRGRRRTPVPLLINEQLTVSALPPGTPVLDFLRQELGLTGTKEGCREGDCGACAVLLGECRDGGVLYRPLASCLLPLGEITGRHLLTIEGLNGAELSPVQRALLEEGGVQCGFCTPGVVVAMTGFLLNSPDFSEADAISALDGNICRCTGYYGIKRAAARVSALAREQVDPAGDRLERLVSARFVPGYLRDIPARLRALQSPGEREDAWAPGEGQVVAGGTDLFVQKPDELREAPLLFLSGRREMADIGQGEGRIRIGAAATVQDLMQSPLLRRSFPQLLESLGQISSTLIRHRATVGGNIVNASPIGDLSIMFLALDSRLHLRRLRAERDVALADFFRGYKTIDLESGEIVQALSFPQPAGDFFFHFEKVGRRQSLDIAGVNSAIGMRVGEGGRVLDIRVSAGGVAPVPLLLRRAAAELLGRTIDSGSLARALRAAESEISPISDVRGSAAYKRLLLRQLFWAHFLRFAPSLNFKEAPS